MADKKIIIDNNGVKEEYLCFYYDGEYESFKNIFERCAPRIRFLLTNNIEEFDKIKDSLYFDDGWYEFTPKNIRDIWKCDTPEKAFLKMSKINCSYRWANVDDVNKHYSAYLPFPFKLNEHTPLALDAVRAGDYLLIKVVKDAKKGWEAYNEGLKEYHWRKNAGCIYSCNGFFVNDVCVEKYGEHEKELPKDEK